MSSLLWWVAALVGGYILLILVRSGHFFRALAFSVVTGNAALFGIGWLGAFSGVLLAVNLFTVAVASLLGVPGVLAMLLLKLLFAA